MSRMITEKLILLAASAAIALGIAVAQAEPADAELEQVRQKVAETFELINPEDIQPSAVEGWYMIQKGSIVAYISADGRYLLQGDIIDLDAQVNLSEVARTDARRDLMASVLDEEVITFTPEDVKYSIAVFTDIDCTYCRRLHSQIEEYMAYGIEVRYLLYPRSGPASRAWNTAEEVWCSSDRQNALTLAKLDRKFDTSPCDSSMVQQHYGIGRDVGLSGTPAIVFPDGTLVAGYMPPSQLAARLEQNAAQ